MAVNSNYAIDNISGYGQRPKIFTRFSSNLTQYLDHPLRFSRLRHSCNTQQNLLFHHLCNFYKITSFTIQHKIIIYYATIGIIDSRLFFKMYS